MLALCQNGTVFLYSRDTYLTQENVQHALQNLNTIKEHYMCEYLAN